MADNTPSPYQDDDQKIAGYFDDVLSPLTAAGIDPDEARTNRDAAIAKVTGNMPAYPGNKPFPARPDTPPTPGASSNGSPSSTVAPSSSPNPAPTKSWDDYAREGLEGQERATKQAEGTIASLSKLPSDDAQIQQAEAQLSKDQTPINSQDAKYKPTMGQKIMRGVRAFAGGGLPGVALADYKAPNRQYGIDKEKQTEQVQADTSNLAQLRKNYEDASARLKGVASEQKGIAAGYKDLTTGATTAQGNDNKQELMEAQAGEKDAKAELERYKAGKDDPTNETELAVKASDPKNPKQAIYKGALSLLAAQKKAGKDTSASDLAKAIQIENFRTGETDRVTKNMQAEIDKRTAALDRDLTIKYDPNKLAAAKQQVVNQVKSEFQPQIDEINARAQDMAGLTHAGQTVNAKEAKRANAKNQPKRLDKNNAKDVATAREYLKKANGDRAKAQQLAEADGYQF